jgi:hypothetical protein
VADFMKWLASLLTAHRVTQVLVQGRLSAALIIVHLIVLNVHIWGSKMESGIVFFIRAI